MSMILDNMSEKLCEEDQITENVCYLKKISEKMGQEEQYKGLEDEIFKI